MKSKKLISFLCAAAMTVSTFAGLAVTASAAETVLWSDTFDGYPNEVKSGEGGGGLPTLYPDVLVDGTTVAGNKYQFIDGVTLYTTGRGDDSSYWVSTEDANGGRAITTSTSRFARQGAGASFNFVDDDGKDKPFEATSGDLVLAFKLKLSDAGESGYDHAFALNDDTNNVVKLGDALTLDKWSDVKIVINSTGATTYVDGAVAGTTLSNVKNLSSINFDSFINGAVANDAVKTTSCPAGYPTWNIDDMVVYTSDNGAESTPPAAVTHPKKGVEFEVVPQGTLSETIEKMPVNEIAKNDFNTRGSTDSNGRYIFTGGSDTGVYDELDIVTLKAGAGGTARGESNWKPVGNTNTDPTLGTDTFLQANMGDGSAAGNGPQMVFKGYGTVNEETGLPELAEREGVSVSFAARLTKGETTPAEMIFSGSLDVSSSTYNLIYPQAMITTDKEAESSVYVVDHALSKDNVVQVNSGEWFLVTMDTYRAEGKTATATIKVTTYPKDGDPVVTDLYSGDVKNLTGNGINSLMSISFRAGNSDTWGVSNSKVEFDNMVIGSTSAEEKPTAAPAPTAAPVKIHDVTIAQSGQNVTVTDNDGEEDAYDAVLIHAGYDNGTLRAVKAYDIKVTDGKATQAVPAADKIYKGDKLMVWDSLKGMVPYGVYEVTDGEEAPTPSPKPTEAPTPTPTEAPTPGAATPTPGAATPTPGAATPTPGAEATPTPGAATPVPKPDKITKAGEATATLAYTAHSQWGSNKAENSVNNDTEYFNNDSADAWAGAAYMQFYVPELDTGLTITKAELSFTVTQGGNSGRTSKLYIANDDIDLTADLKSSGDDLFKSARTEVSDVVTDAGGNAAKDFALDVTSAIKANSTATFILTGNAGGATIMGKPNAKAPVLKLTVADQSTMSTVTIEYKTADGTALTPNDARPTSVTAEKGKAFTATDAMKAPIVVDGKKYVLTSDSATSVTPTDATATLTLTFEEAKKAAVTVKTKAGTQEDTIYTGDVYVGDSVNVFYPKYIKVDDKLYTKASTGGNNPGYWGVTVTPATTEAVTQTVEYTEVADTKAVFFAEGEDEFGDANVSNQNLRCSSGKAGLPPEGTGKTIAKLPAGTYSIEVGVWGGGKTDAAQSTFTVSAGTALSRDITTTGSRIEDKNDDKTFTLTDATTDLVVTTKTKGTSSAGVDYVLITGTTTGTVTPAITGTVTFDPAAPKAGEKVTATVDGLNDGVTAKYAWYVGDQVQENATTNEFTIPADTAAGTKVKVVVTAEGTFGELSKEVEVAAEPEETPGPTESPAPVAPKAAAAATDANITGYEFTEAEGTVTLKGQVAKSKNGAGNDGYWIGFVVNADPGNKITKVYFGAEAAPTAADDTKWITIADANKSDSGDTENKVGFYANLADANPKKNAAVVCEDGKIYKWTMDLTGASIKAAESTATLGAVDTAVKFVGDKQPAEFGTFNYADPTKITGEASYVKGYTAFSSEAKEQEGNYVPVRVSIPESFTGDVSKATVKYSINRTQPTAAAEKTYSEFTTDDKNLDILFFIGNGTTITIKIDLDGAGEEYSEKTYTIDISDLTLDDGNPAADAPSGETSLNGTGASNVIGDVNDLPDDATVAQLGTVTVKIDEDTPADDDYIYYKAEGESKSVSKEPETGNFAAVTLKAPTDDVKGVIVKGYADVQAAKTGTTSFTDDDVTTLTTTDDVTAVLKLGTDTMVYAVAYVEDKTAAAGLASFESKKYQQVGKTLILDFTDATIQKAGESAMPTAAKGTISGKTLTGDADVTENTIFPEGLTVDVQNNKITVSGQYTTAYKNGGEQEGVWVGVVFTPVAEDEKIIGSYVSATQLNATVEKPGDNLSWSSHDDGKPYGYWPDASKVTGKRYVYLLVQKSTDDGDPGKKVFEYELDFNVTKKPADPITVSTAPIGTKPDKYEYNDNVLTVEGIEKHQNGSAQEGYWAGVTFTIPENFGKVKRAYKAVNIPVPEGWNAQSTDAGWDPNTDEKTFNFWLDLSQITNGAKYYVAFANDTEVQKFEITINYKLKYAVTTDVVEDTANGKVTFSLEQAGEYKDTVSATEGTTVYVKVEPKAGYKLKADSLKTNDEQTTITSDNTTYTFTMPAKDVTVFATFEKEKAKFSESVDVTVTGATDTGKTEDELTASVKTKVEPTDVTDVTYKWYRADDEETAGTPIASATNKTYTLAADDIGKYIYVEVIYTGDTYTADKAVTSDRIGPVKTGYTHYTSEDGKVEAVTVYTGAEKAYAGKTYAQLISEGIATNKGDDDDQGAGGKEAITFVKDVLITNSLKVQGGTMTTNGNDGDATATIIKVDASEVDRNSNRLTLKFHSVCSSHKKNSKISIAPIEDVELDTYTFNDVLEISSLDGAIGLASSDTSGVDQSADLTKALKEDADGIIYYIIYTDNAREQQLSNFSLDVAPLYAITKSESMTEGDVKFKVNGAEVEEAVEGDEVTLDITIPEGKEIEKVTYTPSEEDAKDINEDGGVYKFTMPAKATEVNVTYSEKAGEAATLQLIYTTDGTSEDGKVGDPVTVTGEAADNKYTGEEITVPFSYRKAVKVDNSDGTYTIYKYVSGLEAPVELTDATTKHYVKVEKVADKGYYYADFSNYDEEEAISATSTDEFSSVEHGSGCVARVKTILGQNKMYDSYGNGNNAERHENMTLSAAGIGASKKVKIEFKVAVMAGNNTSDNSVTVKDSVGTSVFDLAYDNTNSKFDVSGNDVSSKVTWAKGSGIGVSDYNATKVLSVSAEIDFTTSSNNVKILVKDGETEVYNGTVSSTATNISKITSTVAKKNGGYAIDDILITDITEAV